MPLAAAPLIAWSNWLPRLVAVKLPISGPVLAEEELEDVDADEATYLVSVWIVEIALESDEITEESAEVRVLGEEETLIVLSPSPASVTVTPEMALLSVLVVLVIGTPLIDATAFFAASVGVPVVEE
jgi:hypothetical protein